MKGESPTLLFNNSNDHFNDKESNITKIFPIQFLFGYGSLNNGKDHNNKGGRVKPMLSIKHVRGFSGISKKFF